MVQVNDVVRYIAIALAVCGILFGAYGAYLNWKASDMCKKECNIEGAMGNYLSRSGSYKLDDTCICFFKDKIKVFRLDEEEMCRLKDVCEVDMGFNLGGMRP